MFRFSLKRKKKEEEGEDEEEKMEEGEVEKKENEKRQPFYSIETATKCVQIWFIFLINLL